MVQLKFTPIFVTKLGTALVFKFGVISSVVLPGWLCLSSLACYIYVKEQLGCLII